MNYQENIKTIATSKAALEILYKEQDIQATNNNSALTELITNLTGLKNIACKIGNESTIVSIIYNSSRTHDITIYHRRDYDFKTSSYSDDIKYELSWFSASLKVDEAHQSYIDYLEVLGLLAKSLSKGTAIKEIIEQAIQSTKPINKKIQDHVNICNNCNRANNEIINNLKTFDVAQACARDLDIEITPTRHHISRRSYTTINAVRVFKRTKKMVHYEVREVYTKYLTNEDGSYTFDKDGTRITTQVSEYRGTTAKLNFEQFNSFISQKWPKPFEQYRTEYEAALIQE
ncbi:MAG: hypothetical protein WDA09_06710 [Bacteriovoracaceae bacterium]